MAEEDLQEGKRETNVEKEKNEWYIPRTAPNGKTDRNPEKRNKHERRSGTADSDY